MLFRLFIFRDLILQEGTRVSNNYLIDANNLSGPLTIPNSQVDTSTIRVRVQASTTDLTLQAYTLSNTLLDVSSTSNAFFLEETIDGLYTIRFGDNVVGKKLAAGNIVIVDYMVSKGENTNGAKTFTCTTQLTGANEARTFTASETLSASGGQRRAHTL